MREQRKRKKKYSSFFCSVPIDCEWRSAPSHFHWQPLSVFSIAVFNVSHLDQNDLILRSVLKKNDQITCLNLLIGPLVQGDGLCDEIIQEKKNQIAGETSRD
jgi:hypothetical protein